MKKKKGVSFGPPFFIHEQPGAVRSTIHTTYYTLRHHQQIKRANKNTHEVH